jgi:hypothetical protein
MSVAPTAAFEKTGTEVPQDRVLVVEAVVHHLDLVKNLNQRPEPATSALSITTATLDGLLAQPRPNFWDEVTYILEATGREPLSEEDWIALGPAGDSLPVFS